MSRRYQKRKISMVSVHQPGTQDKTRRSEWRMANAERLISWEILQRAYRGEYGPVDQETLYHQHGLDEACFNKYIIEPLTRFREKPPSKP